MLAELAEHGASEEFQVEPDCWETVQAFLRVQTQWRVGGMGGHPIGLDYAGVEAALRMMRVRDKAELFDGLQVMEAAALEAMKD